MGQNSNSELPIDEDVEISPGLFVERRSITSFQEEKATTSAISDIATTH